MRFFFCLMLLLLIVSCRTVSTEQRRIVNQFALKAENFTALPEKMWTEISEIREARGVYYANSFIDPVNHLNELDAIVKERLNDDKIPAKVGSVFKILDHYADGLVELSSDIPLKTSSLLLGNFGDDLDVLIKEYNNFDKAHNLPTGVGSLITKALDEGSKAYVADRQYKALRKYVNQADTLVSALCTEMVNYLSSEVLNQLIQNEETGIRESFRFYLAKRSPPDITSGKEYITLMKRAENVNSVRLQAIRAAGNLKIAHRKIAEALRRRKTIKETIDDLNRFCQDVTILNSMIKKLN